MPYIAESDHSPPALFSAACREFKIESIILPSCNITIIPDANPTTRAEESISFAPAIISDEILPESYPATIPDTIPIARKSPDISAIYQPQRVTPTTSSTMVAKRIIKIIFCAALIGCGAANGCCSAAA